MMQENVKQELAATIANVNDSAASSVPNEDSQAKLEEALRLLRSLTSQRRQ